MVEIIPKQTIGYSPRIRISLYIVFFLFLSSVVSYFVLQQLVSLREGELATQKELLNAELTQREQDFQKRVIRLKRQIENFARVTEARKNSRVFFSFLEQRTIPEVFFDELNLNPQTHEAILSGQSTDFYALEQQVLVFKADPNITNVQLSNVGLRDGRVAQFLLTLQFNAKIFQ